MKFKNLYGTKYIFKSGDKNQIIWSWYRLGGIILECIILVLIFVQIIYEAIVSNPESIWFGNLHFFTQQSNLIVMAFVLTYCINDNLKIFKNNNLLIVVVSYITVTCLIFCLILLPVGIATEQYSKGGYHYPAAIPSSIFYHLINPIYMMIFFALNVKFNIIKNNFSKHKIRFVAIALIYPICYLIYVSFLPFVKDLSVYGTVTNLNPNFSIWTNKGEVDGNPLNAILFLFVLQIFAAFLIMYRNIIRKKISGIHTNILKQMLQDLKRKKEKDNNKYGSQEILTSEISAIEWLDEDEKAKLLRDKIFDK